MTQEGCEGLIRQGAAAADPAKGPVKPAAPKAALQAAATQSNGPNGRAPRT